MAAWCLLLLLLVVVLRLGLGLGLQLQVQLLLGRVRLLGIEGMLQRGVGRRRCLSWLLVLLWELMLGRLVVLM